MDKTNNRMVPSTDNKRKKGRPTKWWEDGFISY